MCHLLRLNLCGAAILFICFCGCLIFSVFQVNIGTVGNVTIMLVSLLLVGASSFQIGTVPIDRTNARVRMIFMFAYTAVKLVQLKMLALDLATDQLVSFKAPTLTDMNFGPRCLPKAIKKIRIA
jgi:hypothetical protein